MRSNWADIRARIPEAPAWYDVFGVPRYGEPPVRMRPFVVRIKCQSCAAIFRVALVDEVYYGLYGELLTFVGDGRCPANPERPHWRVEYVSMVEGVELTPKPLPEGWHYGDPPAHDCVGDTMNSIPEYEWEKEEA